MNLFQSNGQQQPFNNNYSMPYGGQQSMNPFNRPNTPTNLNNSFGPSSSLSGPNSLFPPSGSNNLFTGTTNNTGNTGGNMWGNNQQTSNSNSNSNLFRSNTMPQNQNSMFPTGGNNSNLFQANSSNSVFPRSNSMLNSGGTNFMGTSSNTPNFQSNLFNTSSAHNYGTRSNELSIYEKGTMNYKFNPSKNNDGLYIYSITNAKGYSKKSLDELRMEDYAFIKSGQVPENIKKTIQGNIQGLEGGGNNMGNMGMGSGGSGVMIGSSSNNLFNTGGMGMNNNNNNSMGGMGMNNNNNNTMGMGNNNLFASNNSNNMQRNTQWPGAGNSNNPFQSNSMNSSFSFGQQGMGNNSNNNLFSQGGGGGSGPNFFNQNQNQQGNNPFNNQQNTSNNNLFNQNRFQTQNSAFPQSNLGMGMQSGNNAFPGSMSNSGNNPFQNRNNAFPQNTGITNNNLFANNRNAPPSLFPNQGQNQMPNSLFPQQGGGQQNGFFPGAGGQLGSNPHLFPPQNNFQNNFPGFPQQNYPQFPGYGPQGQPGFPSMDMSSNPHLFPQQNPYQQTQFQAYMAMQNMNNNDPYNSQGYQSSSIFSPTPEERRQFAPRQTLTDAIMNLDNKRKEEGGTSPRGGGFTYFPYNPFEKKGRKMDANEKENMKNNINLLRPSQMVSKRGDDEDAFTLIKKSKVVEDDVEIIMRPKFFLPTRGRNRSSSPLSTNRSRDNSAEYYARAGGKNIYNNSVKVLVNVTLGSYSEKNMEVRIFRQATINDLKLKVLERLRDRGVIRPESMSLDDLAARCELFYDSRVIHGTRTLDQSAMIDGSSVFLQIDEEHANEEFLEENRRKRQQEESQMGGNSYMGMNGFERGSQGSRYAPKLTKEGYYTLPPIDELMRMSDTDLAMIEGFTIGNEWGKIEFEGRTDVRGLDLDDLVEVRHRAVEVYPEERYPTDASKPIKGEKLNKPAIVTLYKCFFTGKTKGPDFKKSLQDKSARDGNEFIDYDDENGVYKIRVKYF